MRNWKRLLAIVGAAALLSAPLFSRADVGLLTYSVTATGTGTTAGLTLGGQNSCNIQTSGTFSVLSATVQVSPDNGTTWATATGIGASGVITATGTVGGVITTATILSPTTMRLNVGSFTGTSATFFMSCSYGSSVGAVTITGTPSVNVVSWPIPVTQSSASPQPQQSTLPSNSYLYGVNTGKWYPVNCAANSAGCTLSVTPCTSGVGQSAANCATVPAASPAALTDGPGMLTKSQEYRYNGTTWDGMKAAPSPAPVGVPAFGYNAAGLSAPIICTQNASNSASSTTAVQIVAASAGKKIYVCAATLAGYGSAAGSISISSGTQTTNPCDTGTVVGPRTAYNTTGTGSMSIGTGVGAVFTTAASAQLCIVATGTLTNSYVWVNYEQF